MCSQSNKGAVMFRSHALNSHTIGSSVLRKDIFVEVHVPNMFTNTTRHEELNAEYNLDIFTSKLSPLADIAVGLAIMSIGEFDITP